MIPVTFPEANTRFGPPSDLDESQCMAIPGYFGVVRGGSIDGAHVVVTAWKPSPEDIELMRQGRPIFLTFIGGLPPHSVNMTFQAATTFA